MLRFLENPERPFGLKVSDTLGHPYDDFVSIGDSGQKSSLWKAFAIVAQARNAFATGNWLPAHIRWIVAGGHADSIRGARGFGYLGSRQGENSATGGRAWAKRWPFRSYLTL